MHVKKRQDTSKEYCAICKDYHDFVVPSDLFEALVNHELVIFAGAGVSTENKVFFPSTLYEDILGELGCSDDKSKSFSEVMSEYCRKTGDRRGLIDRIRDRIDYVHSFPELHRTVVRFHKQLALIPCIKEIVTTNWDDFFEVECHATPFVYEQDMAFWDRPGRKVLKLHGSINNLGSIVVTFEDYEKKYESLDRGLIGSQLKLLIANRKLAFVGYSFGDEDFNRIHSFVRSQLGDLMKKPYIVTVDKVNDRKWKGLGLEPIYTDGGYFLQVLTHELEKRGCLIPARSIHAVEEELDQMIKAHSRLANNTNHIERPEVVYCLSYQDGIIHAFERFLHHINYGESLCKDSIHMAIKTHERLMNEKKAQRKWLDVAYLKGYLNGYIFVLADKKVSSCFPRYYDLGLNSELRTFNQYMGSLNVTNGRKKSLTNYALRFVKRFPEKDLVIHHPPFL